MRLPYRPRILTPSIRPFGPTQARPFDTAMQAYSGQAVDLQEATTEPACARHLLPPRSGRQAQTGLASALPNIVW